MHHTKVKADIGLCKVITDLTVKGYIPCVPLSEHQSFDLVVVKNEQTFRVQVKFATLRKNGTVEVKYKSSWADRHGTHTRLYKKEEFDYYAVYCPEKDIVLYVPNSPKCPKTLRFSKPVNNQVQSVHWAHEYLDIK